MIIKQLTIKNFRNLCDASLTFSPAFNLIYGQNGSGKTNLLEAIYFLAVGRSFRTHLLQRLVTHGENSFTLFAKLEDEEKTREASLGLSRSSDESITHLNGENVKSYADIARLLPLQIINQAYFALLFDSAKNRRQFIDWVLFHVEHNFLSLWQKLNHILLQRNNALKSNLDPKQLALWDRELTATSMSINELRTKYVNALQASVKSYLGTLLPDIELDIGYYRGWPQHEELASLLEKNFTKDQRLGYTQYGAHRADLLLHILNKPAATILSRGQQKSLFIALKIAQAELLKAETGAGCIHVIDDFTAELDSSKQTFFIDILNKNKGQIFITNIDCEAFTPILSTFSDYPPKLFHVEHGKIKPMS